MPKRKDISGKKIGNLSVIKPLGLNGNHFYWECLCDCGETVNRRTDNLKNSYKMPNNCGCLMFAARSKTLKGLKRSDKAKENYRKSRMGKLNPNYNPLLTDEERNPRSAFEHMRWKREIEKRDNKTCQACFDTEPYERHAHHILGYKDNIDLRFDISNGELLCNICHKEFHSTYGKVGFTKEDYNEFKNNKICLN